MRSIAQDSAGFVWLGTSGGLVRWDGVELRRWAPAELDGWINYQTVCPDGTVYLVEEGGGLFAAPEGVAAQPETNSKFVQHTIEKSNVRGVIEITRMIELSRSYAQVATMLQQQSEMRTGAISKLADVPA